MDNLKKGKLAIILAVLATSFIIGFYQQRQLITLYKKQASPLIKDRNGETITLKPNQINFVES